MKVKSDIVCDYVEGKSILSHQEKWPITSKLYEEYLWQKYY